MRFLSISAAPAAADAGVTARVPGVHPRTVIQQHCLCGAARLGQATTTVLPFTGIAEGLLRSGSPSFFSYSAFPSSSSVCRLLTLLVQRASNRKGSAAAVSIAYLAALSSVRPVHRTAAITSYAATRKHPLNACTPSSRLWNEKNLYCRIHSDSGGPGACRVASLCRKSHAYDRRYLTHFRRVTRLPLDARLRQSLCCMQIKYLTQVQDVTFFPILFGRDVVATARAGTGKTLAYLLPLLQRLLNTGSLSICGGLPPCLLSATVAADQAPQDEQERHRLWLSQKWAGRLSDGAVGKSWTNHGSSASPPTLSQAVGGPVAVILVPTRELCQQVTCTALSLLPSLSVVAANSATSLQQQEYQLAAAPVDIVVGTPSRCLLLHQRGVLKLRNLRCLVLDEADLLLSKGYAETIDRLLEANGYARWATVSQDTGTASKQSSSVARGTAHHQKPNPLFGSTSSNSDSSGMSGRSSVASWSRLAVPSVIIPAAEAACVGEEARVGCIRTVNGQHQKQKQRCPRNRRMMQVLLFSTVMSVDAMKIIESQFQGAATVNLVKDKKGRQREEAKKRESTSAEPGDKEESGFNVSTASGRAAAPPPAPVTVGQDTLNGDTSLERSTGEDRTSSQAYAPSSAPVFTTGASVRHFTCKISREAVAHAAKSSAVPTVSGHLLSGISSASKLPTSNLSTSGSGNAAQSDTEARVLVLLYLLARKLPGPLSAWVKDTKRTSATKAAAASPVVSTTQTPPIEEQGSPKCIIFVDTQQELSVGQQKNCSTYDCPSDILAVEAKDVFVDATPAGIVEDVTRHPLLESWHIASFHSGMTQQERDCNLSLFRTGKAPVLVSTDVLARGLHVPSIVLVVHFRPPADSNSYIHRAGRAGRGGVAGESVVLYTPDEWSKVKKLTKETHTDFLCIPPPTVTEYQEVTTNWMFQTLLEVEYEHYAPHLSRAARLLKSHGNQILASALTLLYGSPHSSAGKAYCETQYHEDTQELRSLLTGRKNFAALLLYDPAHSLLKTSEEAARYIRHLLPSTAPSSSLGRIIRSTRGYVADVAVEYANHLISKANRRQYQSKGAQAVIDGVSIRPVEELPQLLLTKKATRDFMPARARPKLVKRVQSRKGAP